MFWFRLLYFSSSWKLGQLHVRVGLVQTCLLDFSFIVLLESAPMKKKGGTWIACILTISYLTRLLSVHVLSH